MISGGFWRLFFLREVHKKALLAAFPHTIPVLTGFLFLGATYGIYMRSLGFSAAFPICMSLTVFAGSMEFVAGDLLLGAFHPLQALALTLSLNARHLFYGLSMLDKYKGLGRKESYLIYGLCDETFSINCSVQVPEGVDRGWFYFFVTALDQCYWVSGATLGAAAGGLLKLNTEGLDFVMTAMFVVIFLEQWHKERKHTVSLLGLGLSAVCLAVFGAQGFLLPAMAAILVSLTALRGRLEGEEAQP